MHATMKLEEAICLVGDAYLKAKQPKEATKAFRLANALRDLYHQGDAYDAVKAGSGMLQTLIKASDAIAKHPKVDIEELTSQALSALQTTTLYLTWHNQDGA